MLASFCDFLHFSRFLRFFVLCSFALFLLTKSLNYLAMAANLAALAAFLSSPPASPRLLTPEILPSLTPNRSARDFNFLAWSVFPVDEEEPLEAVGRPNRSAHLFRFSAFSAFAAFLAAILSDFVVDAVSTIPNLSARLCFLLSSSLVVPDTAPLANLFARACFRSTSDTLAIFTLSFSSSAKLIPFSGCGLLAEASPSSTLFSLF